MFSGYALSSTTLIRRLHEALSNVMSSNVMSSLRFKACMSTLDWSTHVLHDRPLFLRFKARMSKLNWSTHVLRDRPLFLFPLPICFQPLEMELMHVFIGHAYTNIIVSPLFSWKSTEHLTFTYRHHSPSDLPLCNHKSTATNTFLCL